MFKKKRFILLALLSLSPLVVMADNDPYPTIYDKTTAGILPNSIGFNSVSQDESGIWQIESSIQINCKDDGIVGYSESYTGQHIFTGGYAIQKEGLNQTRYCYSSLTTDPKNTPICTGKFVYGALGQGILVSSWLSMDPQNYSCAVSPASATTMFESQVMLHTIVNPITVGK